MFLLSVLLLWASAEAAQPSALEECTLADTARMVRTADPSDKAAENFRALCEFAKALGRSKHTLEIEADQVALNGTSDLPCATLSQSNFAGMQVDSIIAEALLPMTRVLYKKTNSLEYLPERLTLMATEQGQVMHWYCG